MNSNAQRSAGRFEEPTAPRGFRARTPLEEMAEKLNQTESDLRWCQMDLGDVNAQTNFWREKAHELMRRINWMETEKKDMLASIQRRGANEDKLSAKVATKEEEIARHMKIVRAAGECPICCERMEAPTISNGGHTFCAVCMNKCMQTQCPVCRTTITNTGRWPDCRTPPAPTTTNANHRPPPSPPTSQSPPTPPPPRSSTDT